MKFRYRRLKAGDEPRPLVPFTIKYGGKESNWYGLLDSGADKCLFPLEIAEQVGIDAYAGEKITGIGIGNTIDTWHVDNVALVIGGYEFNASVGFADCPTILLGRIGIFERFKVRFDERGKEVELIPYK